MKKYQIIYADPPWFYHKKMKSSGGGGTNLSLERHYPTMKIEDIKKLPISKIAANDCVLFLWTTDAHLRLAMDVIEAWGFKYKSVGFYWIKKEKSGKQVCYFGSYTMKCGELCLIATKGSATKLIKSHKVRSLLESPRGKHSEKPNEARGRIEQFLGDRPRIELFARQKTEGWDVWGNEVKSDIEL